MQYRNKFDYQLLNLLNFQLKRNTVLVYIQQCNSKYDWLCAKFHVNVCGYFVIRYCNSNSIVLCEVIIYRFSTREIHNKIYKKPIPTVLFSFN